MRVRAAEACARLGDVTAIDALTTMLQDSNEDNRQQAAHALACLGSDAGIGELRHSAMMSNPWFVRKPYMAIVSLSRLNTPEARRIIEEVGASSQLDDVRRFASDTLDRGHVAALGTVIEENTLLANYAVNALDLLSDPAALPALERAQEIGDSETRLAARLVARRLRRLARIIHGVSGYR